MANKYYAEYRSGNSGSVGCVNAFMTSASDTNVFPPQVEKRCDLCNKNHSFYLHGTHLAATPKQVDRIERYCDDNNFQRDVEIAD